MLLAGPTGATCGFWGRAGFDQAVSNLTITLDDDAADFLSEPGPLSSGTFKPTFYPFNNPFSPSTFPTPAPNPGGDVSPDASGAITLSTFLNIDPNGQWDLYIVDELAPDSGSISGGWSLTITTEGPQTPNLHFDRTHNAESRFGTVTANNFSVGTQWAICTTDPLIEEGDCFQWMVAGDIPQLYVGVVDDPNLDLGADWPNTTITRFPYGVTVPEGLRAFFDHPDPETVYDEEVDLFKIVRNSDGLSFYRNGVFLDKRFAGVDPTVLPNPMPPLYPAWLGAYQIDGEETLFNGISGAQSCASIPATYNCTPEGCIDPGDGTGTFTTLSECLIACGISESYNCINGVCTDPGDGSGVFSTLQQCQESGCGAISGDTIRFAAGNGSRYYFVSQVTDSGDELRSKTIKTVRQIGRRTNVSATVYGYDVEQGISIADLENGTRSNTRMITRPQELEDSTEISQSRRKPIDVKNAVLSAVRLEGDDRGQTERDRIDEIVLEQAVQGVRR
jgi:hypothetical protein